MNHRLAVGDHVRLRGGYDMFPLSETHREGFLGTVVSFIPGQNTEQAAVIELQSPITFDGLSGAIMVLELRYEHAKWESEGTVHFELCDFLPEPKTWNDRRRGKWIESQGTYEIQKETS